MKKEERISKEDYKIISEMIEKKISILRQNKDFNEKYLRLTDTIDELEEILDKKQKEKLNELIKLFYETEEYYFAFSYILGTKKYDL